MTRGRATRLATAMCAVAALLTLAACTDSPVPDGAATLTSDSPKAVELGTIDEAATALTDTLPVQAVGDAPPADGVAEGLLAPTNRWYSSLAYAPLPARAFPTPVAVQVDQGSIGIALPTVSASDALIAATAQEFLAISVRGAGGRPQVSVNDPVYTSLEFSGDDGLLATATIAQGWPALGLIADADVTLELSATPAWDGTTGIVTVAGMTYAVSAPEAERDGRELSLSAGQWLMAFPIPADTSAAAYIEAMGSPVTSVATTGAEGSTSLEYTTVGGGTTVLVPPANVEADVTDPTADATVTCERGSFLTIDGPTVGCQGSTLAWTVDTIEPRLTLDAGRLNDEQREAVLSAIAEDAVGGDYPSDTYFGAKALYRDAQLLAVAADLGDDASAALLGDRLAEALGAWTDASRCERRTSRCFVYDPNWNGVVGYDTSYGSEEFNDHHFHYGYLIYATAIAVERGVVALEDVAPVIDALVADIASEGTMLVPTTRVFDPYAGHSWAAGTAEFADGNNQESSSEAVNAWTAVAAWAQLRGDEAAYDRAVWMLSAEAHAALSLYVRPDTSFAPEYLHQVVGIEWGGKRDWATWFSADPAAMLGIQLIPLNPTQQTLLKADSDEEHTRILASIAEAMPSGTAPQFTDLITMYASLADTNERATAWDIALTLPESAIDDGLSRAYMLTFIATAG